MCTYFCKTPSFKQLPQSLLPEQIVPALPRKSHELESFPSASSKNGRCGSLGITNLGGTYPFYQRGKVSISQNLVKIDQSLAFRAWP